MVDSKSDSDIRHILSTTKVIALVGASDKPDRASNRVLAFLRAKGFEVVPVNPGLAGKQIHGATVVASLSSVAKPIDLVDVFRNSEDAGKVIDEALALAPLPKAIWLQLGVVHIAAATRAEARGVAVVMDRCPAIEMPRLGL